MSIPPRRALLVIDVQNEYFSGGLPIEHPPLDVSLPNILLAMDAARTAAIPVVVVRHDAPADAPLFAAGSDGWRLHSSVAERPADHLVGKSKASALAGTGLREWLAARAIDTLTIAGYMSHNCDAATIYQASHDGLAVEFLSDASGALPYENGAGKASAEEIHRVFCTVFHSGFAAVVTTRAWIAAVEARQALPRDGILASNRRARAAAGA